MQTQLCCPGCRGGEESPFAASSGLVVGLGGPFLEGQSGHLSSFSVRCFPEPLTPGLGPTRHLETSCLLGTQ